MAKIKISITVDERLLKRADRLSRGTSRSEVFERALRGYLRSSRQSELEAETEAYYRELTEKEREEDAAWSELGAGVTGKTWS